MLAFLSSSKKSSKTAGFTLIELIVVMVIIGILSTIGLGSFFSGQAKARDARRKRELQQVATALQAFYADHGYYPPSDSLGRIVVYYQDEFGNDQNEIFDWGEVFYDPNEEMTIYMEQIPEDPSGGKYYYQAYQRNIDVDGGFELHDSMGADHEAEAFKIFALLENSDDSDVIEPVDGTDCDSITSSTTNCNYSIKSTNLPL